jgi:hypothetical protein
MSDLVPPKPRQPLQVDAAEFIALRTIVMSLVATMASQHEALGGGTAQGWINRIAASCQEDILAASIIASDGRDLEGLRREAMEHVNHILGGVRFPGDRDNSN